MLSERDRCTLREIERRLVEGDPGLAQVFRDPGTTALTRWVPTALAVALGVMLVAAVLSLPIAAVSSAGLAVGVLAVHAVTGSGRHLHRIRTHKIS